MGACVRLPIPQKAKISAGGKQSNFQTGFWTTLHLTMEESAIINESQKCILVLKCAFGVSKFARLHFKYLGMFMIFGTLFTFFPM